MIQGYFHSFIGAKTIRASGYHSDFVVQALDGTAGDFTFGLEPVQQQAFVRAQHPCDLFHWFQAAPQCPFGPRLHEAPRPSQRTIAPEWLKGFLEDPRPGCSQFAGRQCVELLAGFATHATASTQQLPAHAFELGGSRRIRLAQSSTLSPPHFVDGLVQVHRNVKTVQHVQRVAHPRGNHIQVRPPHVATHKLQTADHFRAQGGQASAQGRLGAPLAHPQQSPTMPVNLVDHRQKIIRTLAPAPVNLIDADGVNVDQLPVHQTPFHKPFHRAINAFPTGAKYPRRFAPGQPPRPSGKKAHHSGGHRSLAITPRNVLDHHAVLRTLDPPQGINEPRNHAPHRYKQPGTRRQSVIAGRWLETPRAFGRNACVRQDDDLHLTRLARPQAQQPNISVNKARKMLNVVQKRLNLQLHRWSLGGWFVFFIHSQTNPNQRDQRCLFHWHHAARGFELKGATGRAFELLARARLRSRGTMCLPGYPQILLYSRNTNHACFV